MLLANTFQVVRDCALVNGGSGCAPLDKTASTRDSNIPEVGVLDNSQADLTNLTNLKRGVPDGTTLTCDDQTAPLSKDAVKHNFFEKYCGRIDGEVFRNSGIEEVCTELITTMYMFVRTIHGDWVCDRSKPQWKRSC
jgi:hypothetical protein